MIMPLSTHPVSTRPAFRRRRYLVRRVAPIAGSLGGIVLASAVSCHGT